MGYRRDLTQTQWWQQALRFARCVGIKDLNGDEIEALSCQQANGVAPWPAAAWELCDWRI